MAPELNKPRVVILGAGLAGLSAGWLLQKSGYTVTILEKEAFNGGLAVTKTKDSFSYDLGPHNLHTNHSHIQAFLLRNFKNLFENLPTFKILKNGKFITYPIMGAKVVTSLPGWKIPIAIASFLTTRVRIFFFRPRGESNFRDWVINRFGRILYREYFHDYPVKVWGLPTDQIHRYVAEQRIPTTTLAELIQAVFRKPYKVKHHEFTDKNFYLRRGVGEIPSFFEEEFRQAGGSIRNSTSLKSVSIEEGRARSVTFETEGKTDTIPCEFLLSTIPIPDFADALPSLPPSVRESSQGLAYRSSVLLFMKFEGKIHMPAHIVYFSSPKHLFSRVYDVGAFSRDMVPQGKNLLCLEIPSKVGDLIWNSPVEELAKRTLLDLEDLHLVKSDSYTGAFVEKVSHSYPQFDLDYLGHMKVFFDYVSSLSNVLSYGRQGGFEYINTDTVTHLGFHAAKAVIMSGAAGYSCAEWFRMKR